MITYKNVQALNAPTVTNRQLIGVEVELNSNLYNWTVYTPLVSGEQLSNYLEQIANIVELDILRKESIWDDHPKTRETINPFTNETEIVDINKESIVNPTIPDYVEALAKQYSKDQLSAILQELGINYWQYPQYAKRIIAPIQLILDDIGIKMYGWFTLNKLPILNLEQGYVHLYCNEILPEHMEIIDQLQEVITIEQRP
jgi:hypothetical protein